MLREWKHLSLSQLASRLDTHVSRQSIAKYETDYMRPRPSTLKSICKVLNVSPEYILRGYDFKWSPPTLRKADKSKIAPEFMEELLTNVNSWLASYLYTEEQVGTPHKFANPLTELTISTKNDAEQAALALRKAWDIGIGAIPNLCRLAERKGVCVFNTPLPKNLLGLNLWADDKYPVIILNYDHRITTIERIRFTIAHELGHLLLHFSDHIEFKPKNPDDAPKEKLCEIFAANLLLPRPTLYEELGERRDFLTLEELIDIREQYGVSIAAIVHQAHDLGIITDDHYNWWYDERINKNKCEEGWGSYPVSEHPTRLMRFQAIIAQKEEREGKLKSIF